MTDFAKGIVASINEETLKAANAKNGAPAGTNGNSAPQQTAPTDQTDASKKPSNESGSAPSNEPQQSLREILKARNIELPDDLSDDDILQNIKGGKALGPASQQKPAEPEKIEATDDEVVAYLEKSGKTRDYFNTAQELSKKEDFDVVRLHWQEVLLKENPAYTPEEIDDLLKERYFISEDENLYQPHEKKFGQAALKAEADRLRAEGLDPVEDARSFVRAQKQAAAQLKAHGATVDQFLTTAPKSIDIKIGKGPSGTHDLGDYNFPVPPEIQTKVAAIMKNPGEIAKAFSGPDNKLDLNKVYSMFVKNELFDNLTVSLAKHYHSKGVDAVENVLNVKPDLTKTSNQTKVTEDQRTAQEHNEKNIKSHVGSRR